MLRGLRAVARWGANFIFGGAWDPQADAWLRQMTYGQTSARGTCVCNTRAPQSGIYTSFTRSKHVRRTVAAWLCETTRVHVCYSSSARQQQTAPCPFHPRCQHRTLASGFQRHSTTFSVVLLNTARDHEGRTEGFGLENISLLSYFTLRYSE